MEDLPETLVTNLKNYYPTKSMSVHSVITNNEACRTAQTQASATSKWPTLGFIGTQYKKLSNPSASLMALGNILKGNVGSICEFNYGAQLGDISRNIKNHTMDAPKQLSCVPEAGSIGIITQPSGYENQIQYSLDEKNKIYFYNLPVGVEVTFSYSCPKY